MEWRVVGVAGDGADVAAVACVGDLVFGLTGGGALVWRRAAEGAAWHATTVRRANGAAWPILNICCLAAGASARLLAVDSAGMLWSVERAGGAAAAAGGAAWVARVIGSLGPHVVAVAVVLGHLAVLVAGADGRNVVSFSALPVDDIVAAAASSASGEAAASVSLIAPMEARNVSDVGGGMFRARAHVAWHGRRFHPSRAAWVVCSSVSTWRVLLT